MAFDQILPTRLFAFKSPVTLVRKFKANDKITKRGLTGAESAEKERQIAEAIETKKKKNDAATAKKTEKKRVAAVKAVKKKRIVAEKVIIVAAKIAKNKRVKKAQKVVKID
jgi:sucrose-6-phosphate hydrolase SacC (GH32 family)